VAAIEVLVRNLAIATLIRESKSHQIPNAIITGKKEGMQLLDQHLKELVSRNLITVQEAVRYADSPQAFAGLSSTANLAMNA